MVWLFFKDRTSFSIAAVDLGSREDVGSSISKTSDPTASVRAKVSRCCPWESVGYAEYNFSSHCPDAAKENKGQIFNDIDY